MYFIEASAKFKRDKKRLVRRGYDMALLQETIDLLAAGEPMPESYSDHALKGSMKEYRECHVAGKGDWLLVYKKYDNKLVLLLSETGTHQDVFGW